MPEDTQKLLRRRLGGQIHFNDVFNEPTNLHTIAWWQFTDFDAPLTVQMESMGFPDFFPVAIGGRPWFTPYGLLLVDDLLTSRLTRLSRAYDLQKIHPDLAAELEESHLALGIIANYAPRDEASTAQQQNGASFFLAITTSGLEIYTTQLAFLSSLEAHGRLLKLYRIPNQNHPEFNGEQEQFRSARIIRSRRHPEHLELLFDYPTLRERLQAVKDGKHPPIIPPLAEGRISFVDKFGNVKLELPNVVEFDSLLTNEATTLVITNQDKVHELSVIITTDLKSAPLNQLAIYRNTSDVIGNYADYSLFELVVRTDGNPTHSQKTAAYELVKRIPNLDFASAQIKLKY